MFLESEQQITHRLSSGETFRFRCHRSLSCFNSCCRNKHLPLTPYDVLRLKGALGMGSDAFLEAHTLYRIDPGSGFPVISLRMSDTADKACPFVAPEGCAVYGDRPTACRLFPLGRLSRARSVARGQEEVYTLLDAGGCLGTAEGMVWTPETWVRNQELGPYLRMNDALLALVFHPGRNRKAALSGDQLQKVMVACYNLDVFREFVFGTSFLEQVQIPAAVQSRCREDDGQLLLLAFAYLERVLFRDAPK